MQCVRGTSVLREIEVHGNLNQCRLPLLSIMDLPHIPPTRPRTSATATPPSSSGNDDSIASASITRIPVTRIFLRIPFPIGCRRHCSGRQHASGKARVPAHNQPRARVLQPRTADSRRTDLGPRPGAGSYGDDHVAPAGGCRPNPPSCGTPSMSNRQSHSASNRPSLW